MNELIWKLPTIDQHINLSDVTLDKFYRALNIEQIIKSKLLQTPLRISCLSR